MAGRKLKRPAFAANLRKRSAITDEVGQLAVSGKSVDDMMAGLSRYVFTGRAGANALKPIFNKREIRAGFGG